MPRFELRYGQPLTRGVRCEEKGNSEGEQVMIGRIPVKQHKKAAELLFILAPFIALCALLAFMYFFEGKSTSGILWWKETTTFGLGQRLAILFLAIALTLVAIVSLIAAIKLSLMSGRFNKYLPVIKGCDQIAIQQIAAMMNHAPHQVVSDLQDMIDSGYIKGYYIDYQRQMLVERGDLPRNIIKKVVKCPACGGDTQITIGIVSYCKFCKCLMPDER